MTPDIVKPQNPDPVRTPAKNIDKRIMEVVRSINSTGRTIDGDYVVDVASYLEATDEGTASPDFVVWTHWVGVFCVAIERMLADGLLVKDGTGVQIHDERVRWAPVSDPPSLEDKILAAVSRHDGHRRNPDIDALALGLARHALLGDRSVPETYEAHLEAALTETMETIEVMIERGDLVEYDDAVVGIPGSVRHAAPGRSLP